MKTKRYRILIFLAVFVVVSIFAASNVLAKDSYDEDYYYSYDSGFMDGYDQGYQDGYDGTESEDVNYNDYTIFDQAYYDGYQDGYLEGFEEACEDKDNSDDYDDYDNSDDYDDSYDYDDYDDSYDYDDYDDSFDYDDYEYSYDQGYQDGYDDGYNNGYYSSNEVSIDYDELTFIFGQAYCDGYQVGYEEGFDKGCEDSSLENSEDDDSYYHYHEDPEEAYDCEACNYRYGGERYHDLEEALENNYEEEPWVEYMIAVVTANIRKGPGTNYDAIDLVREGEELVIVGETYGDDGRLWYEISGGNFVIAGAMVTEYEYFVRHPELYLKDVNYYLETRVNSNVRLGPSTDYEIVDVAEEGELIGIYYEENGWYYTDKGGFIFAKLFW